MSIPYRWNPSGTNRAWTPPEVGSLIALEHAVWRVIEIRYVPEVDWTDLDRRRAADRNAKPLVVALRPASLVGDDPKLRSRDVHLRGSTRSRWDVYPGEHYPVCGKCAEPLPCREQMADRMVDAATARMDQYSTSGVCPACSEPITSRQKTITFADNTEIPGGPPVMFHARRGCRFSATQYEEKWAAADPEHRRVTMSCPGWITNHGDGTYECSREHDCPGLKARHQSFRRCDCPGCHTRADFDCHPAADAVPRGFGVQQEPIPFPEGNPPS